MHDSSDPTDQNTVDASSRADDLEQLRERLAFYESFDKLIQDNVSRAGDLLREAAARKSEGDVALRSAVAEIEQKQLAERVNFRRIFSALLDEVTSVQQNVERIARQVADALDDLEGVIPAPGEGSAVEDGSFPAMPTFSAGSAGELSTGFPASAATEQMEHAVPPPDEVSGSGSSAHGGVEEHQPHPVDSEHHHTMEPVDELVTPDDARREPPATADATTGGGMEAQTPAPEMSQLSAEPNLHVPVTTELRSETYRGEGITVDVDQTAQQWRDPSGPEEQLGHPDNGQPAADAVEDEAWVDVGSAATTTLLIHGVPRATTALSLKRYLEGLAQVHSVEPREYAEGVLRLQVSSDRPVGLEDLQGWPEAEGLSPVTVSEEFVEVRLGASSDHPPY